VLTELRDLPTPSQPVPVAVYQFADLTGQHKPNDEFAEYSRAVTQGGVSMLVKALKEAGAGRWFMVSEREGIESLLRERQIIRTVRAEYRQPDGSPLPDVLRPLTYPGVLLMGGITAYDSNIVTGGAGARYLGIGGNVEYRLDSVTVDLRVVSVRDGQVYAAVTADKSVYSVLTQGGVFRIVGTDNLLEIEAGFSRNEPVQLAVRQAIQKAIYGMVFEGALNGLWTFEDPKTARPLLEAYLRDRDGHIDETVLASIVPPPAPEPTPPVDAETLQGERMLLRELPAEPRSSPTPGYDDYPPLPSGAGRNRLQNLR
jgi:curli production assembly/transport component CsgG